jgi:hypothetical protein
VSPERRRRAVSEVRHRLGPDRVSERRVCRVLQQPRGTQRDVKRRPADDEQLLAEMRRIARRRPRFGSPRVHRELRRLDWPVNHKRVERLWREEGMQVPGKQHRRRRLSWGGSENSCVRRRANGRTTSGRMTSSRIARRTVVSSSCWSCSMSLPARTWPSRSRAPSRRGSTSCRRNR